MSLHDVAISPPPSGLSFSARVENGYVIATLSGELDVACTPVLREQLLAVLMPTGSRLVVDLSKVSFCDASGLAVLVRTSRRAILLGGTLRLVAPSPAVAVALRLSGLLPQFDIFATVVAATTHQRMVTRTPGEPAVCVKRLRPCSLTATRGAMPIPTADSPARSVRWHGHRPTMITLGSPELPVPCSPRSTSTHSSTPPQLPRQHATYAAS